MALFMCLLMIGGVVAIIFPFFGIKSYAAETDYINMTISEKVRVGLMYGSNVTVGFQVKSKYGFDVGYLEDNNFYKLWQVTDETISVTCDSNLSKTGMTFLKTNSSTCAVGGWHIEVDVSNSQKSISALLDDYASTLDYNVFPAYINGNMVLRIGQFGSQEQANNAVSQINGVTRVVSPSDTAVSLIDPYNDKILFEFDSVDSKAFGVTAVQNGTEPSYLITPADNYYEGIFEFKRYINSGTDGVALTNVLPMDDYVTGVLPSEIGTSWPIEVQKAFAVTVRTFTSSMMGRHHSQYGFDMCNTTHCQVYTGIKRATNLTRQAVKDSSGYILTYKGEPARTYYSAVAGGVTVSGVEAWGGNDHPYLKAVATPWENYAGHKNGSWTTEVTPKQLLTTLVNKGYTSLRGEIADVRINKFAENSSYVYSITVTDTYGKSVTIDRCDTIRTSFSPYLNSANFVVAKAGETVTIQEYSLSTDKPINKPTSNNVTYSQQIDSSDINIMTADGLVTLDLQESISIVKDIGSETVISVDMLTVLTDEGKTLYDMTKERISSNSDSIPETTEPSKPIDMSTLPDLSNILALPVIKTEKNIVAEGAKGNFVFIGKGWGHGVGMSQHGAMNMAELGYNYKTILTSYFPGTEIVKYK